MRKRHIGFSDSPRSDRSANLVAAIPEALRRRVRVLFHGGTAALLALVARCVGERQALSRAVLQAKALAVGASNRAVAVVRESARRPWCVLLACILASIWALHHFVLTEIAPFYPLYGDQNDYLASAYQYADLARRKGVFAPLATHFLGAPSGLTFTPTINLNMSLVAGYVILAFGDSRLAALSLHFSSWALLLGVIFWVVKQLSRSSAFGLIAVGFVLFTNLPFVGAGGITDFRIDFLATCWMGISISLWTLFFYRPRALIAWAAAGAVAVLLFFRIITLTYVGLPLAFLFILALDTYRTNRRISLRHAIRPLVALGAWTILLFASGRTFIKSYYLDTALGPEIAARGADKTWQSGFLEGARYYPESLALHHVGGWPLAVLSVAVLAVVVMVFLDFRGRRVRRRLPLRGSAVAFALLAVICPLVILSINPHRTVQVAGVAGIPLIVAGLLPLIAARRHLVRWINHAGMPVLLVATFIWILHLFATAPFQKGARREAELLNRIYHELYTNLAGLPRDARFYAVIDFEDAFFGYGAWFYGRERLGRKARVVSCFPLQIFETDSESILKQIRGASAVIVPRDPAVLETRPFPISRSMHLHFDDIVADVRSRLSYRLSFSYRRVDYDLFVVEGESSALSSALSSRSR